MVESFMGVVISGGKVEVLHPDPLLRLYSRQAKPAK
jgi:hypothetical protein